MFSLRPMGSLLASLHENNVSESSILNIKLMTASLQHARTYWTKSRNGDEPLVETIGNNADLRVTIFGRSDDGSCVDSPHPRLAFVRTEQKLLEHINLIETKSGQSYVWYESYHDVVAGRECFKGGAYLIKISRDKAKTINETFNGLGGHGNEVAAPQPRLVYA
jgi:hypothetical protein